ncbi:chromosomal replication initiator protein DnaA [Pediococcus claussenii]|uniref:Chromosomal replication initiator protein DnaA n=1 Tax=Pediococcus claussenii (strain ATCC BAA-344 / DSM 14800 / JCM 18046 / KCTC 3811 / LMG 21948 / P06) TaxID=701521 RepID=G8PE79_PEDCP|nr:chromosomal replication initiator protein DnaA [Pediococcus claussenii]AEV94340.1 chromosomal replication initiator protein DnaA [Pediococcus claussenii ATCC BAA-344]ANZ69564.1 chromosomal replication initiation protein DnaA [Pediococcus claussenii]ANZ71381.1 chromosomal replication initiation protein DnaA [Pediococcus claussenii]
MPDYNQLWEQIRSAFENDSSMSKASYNAWVAVASPVSLKNKILTIKVPSSLHKDYWEKHLAEKFIEYAYQFADTDITPAFVIKDPNAPDPDKAQQAAEKKEEDDTQLNSRYTFDTFVTGSGNQMAHAAALAVSEDPGTLYNPLFFYGGVGLGKTHLMHAIGHQILKNNPDTRVKYVTSETFTNDFINSLQKNRQDEFHSKYRNVDLLLVDDVQFFADKEATQEEFFHTFEALYNAEKQIVLTSDRIPNEIPKLQERLVSRFKWGLSVDITPPNLETRIAILREKAIADNVDIPDETLTFIADQVDSNIRELEGAMARIQAYATLQNATITTELAGEALRSLSFGSNLAHVSIALIQSKVADYFHVTVSDLKGKKRVKSIVTPRQIAMYLARDLTDNSLPQIGTEFGGKDHTTVIHAYEKVKDDLENDEDLQRQIGDLKSELKA